MRSKQLISFPNIRRQNPFDFDFLPLLVLTDWALISHSNKRRSEAQNHVTRIHLVVSLSLSLPPQIEMFRAHLESRQNINERERTPYAMSENHEKITDWREKKINENNNNNGRLCVYVIALVWFGILFLMSTFRFDLIWSFLFTVSIDSTVCMLGVWCVCALAAHFIRILMDWKVCVYNLWPSVTVNRMWHIDNITPQTIYVVRWPRFEFPTVQVILELFAAGKHCYLYNNLF